ncbi:ABC transporter ATP-binding protein [Hoyosella altamirensis]|uniref:Putative ABC transport system ATP-binding protein n=1 Tax=Hoyosella altamirensis TaxID=616997 RepID=A0A839RN77_9ACTN|nr:ABC transporter ATP-binding protein [Hoyosella altamirensis]MBB3037463.1 putative ABC transport system ATP-binding protein [Hoyosella altamirensis]
MSSTRAPSAGRSRDGQGVLRRVFRRNRGLFPLGTLLLCVYQVAETLIPIAIGLIIDRVISPADEDALIQYGAFLIGLFIVIVVTWRFGSRIVKRVVENEAHRLRVEVATRILDPRGVRLRSRVGALLTVSTQGAENAASVLSVVARGVAALAAAIVAIGALLYINLTLGLVVIVATPLILGGLQRVSPTITQRASAQNSAAGWASALATDLVSGLRPLRGIGGEDMAAHRYRTQSRIALRAAVRSARINGLYTSASYTANGVLAVVVAGYGGYLALAGEISPGELIAVVGLSQFLPGPLGALAAMPRGIAIGRASSQRLDRILGAEFILTPGPLSLPKGRRDLEIASVSYKTLKGVSLKVEAGELIGVLSYDPNDADALVAVLSGRLPVDEYRGRVLVGGVPIAEVAPEHAQRALLVEPHRTDLFTGTIGSNVRAGRPEALDEQVEVALDASAARDVVTMHEEGLEHPVTDRGESLSGGQRQRVALARALVAAPSVLVLHDPTTAVDAVTEQTIAQGIAELRHRSGPRVQSTIIVTSSPALLSFCDHVVVLEDGQVARVSTHEHLAATDENYRRVVLR